MRRSPSFATAAAAGLLCASSGLLSSAEAAEIVKSVLAKRLTSGTAGSASLLNGAALIARRLAGAPAHEVALAEGAFAVQVVDGKLPQAAASGSFNDATNTTGWATLSIEGSNSADDETIAYSAGYLESQLTFNQTNTFIYNSGSNYTWDGPLTAYLNNNTAYLHSQIEANPSDPYWRQVNLILLQLNGLYDAYMSFYAAGSVPPTPPFSQPFPFTAFMNLQITGDMDDLSAALGVQQLLGGAQGLDSSIKCPHRVAQLKKAWLQGGQSLLEEEQELLQEQGLTLAQARRMQRGDSFLALKRRLQRTSLQREGSENEAVRQALAAARLQHKVEELSSDVAADTAFLQQELASTPIMPTNDGSGHCSALLKLTAGDALVGQTTWSGFEDMSRIYKSYILPYSLYGSGTGGQTVPNPQMTLSGYPGTLFSGDDWYVMQPAAAAAGTGALVVLETTIGNGNATLYNLFITPQSVLDWTRNLVANRLGQGGEGWAQVFSRENSGTYNNEFFIVDYSKFNGGNGPLRQGAQASSSREGEELDSSSSSSTATSGGGGGGGGGAVVPASGFFWLLDQAPGYINASDMTSALVAQGYWPSYNVAAFPFIYDITGGAEAAQQYGPWFSYNETARANIFRRDQGDIIDATGFQSLLRYNDFQNDPLSTQGCSGNPPYSAENAVAARDDLNSPTGVYPISALGFRDHAAIDAKMTSASLLAQGMLHGQLLSQAQSGPTYDQQPAFSWSTALPQIAALPHLGQPDLWAFPWVNASFPIYI